MKTFIVDATMNVALRVRAKDFVEARDLVNGIDAETVKVFVDPGNVQIAIGECSTKAVMDVNLVRRRPTCPKCGSDHLQADAVAVFDADMQEWVSSFVHVDDSDNPYTCGDCGEETVSPKWVEV